MADVEGVVDRRNLRDEKRRCCHTDWQRHGAALTGGSACVRGSHVSGHQGAY